MPFVGGGGGDFVPEEIAASGFAFGEEFLGQVFEFFYLAMLAFGGINLSERIGEFGGLFEDFNADAEAIE